MDSRRLSLRAKAPGSDRTFEASEKNFVAALRKILPPAKYRIVDHPKDLSHIFSAPGLGQPLGIRPEASIENIATGRKMYFEVKKQNDSGNAEERAAKHHTVQFQRSLKEITGYSYHAYCTIFCDALATNYRYTSKFPYFYEEGHYLLWVDYDPKILEDFITKLCARFLD